MIIAIDGPAGAGKGTIARYLATRFSLIYFDTGLVYRALAKAVITARINPSDTKNVVMLARLLDFNAVKEPGLRTEEIADIASQIAIMPEVRHILNNLQRQFCYSVTPPYQGAILDGRDIGTIICPDAPCKLFITARPEVRNHRRFMETSTSFEENAQYLTENLTAIAQKIFDRDTRDTNREIAPLSPALDAYVIDTSDLTVDESCDKAAKHVLECCLTSEINQTII